MLKVVDLFCGTGGFSLCFEKEQVVLANDFVKSSEVIYKLNFPKCNYILDSIFNLQAPKEKIDIITGGISCQPFSIAGKLLGFEDPRSNVFWKMLDLVNTLKPRIVVIENVKNLLTHDNGNSLKCILDCFTELNYRTKYGILDTCKITGIPQHRERIYILAFSEKRMYDNFTFDFEQVKCQDISTFLDKNVHEKYHYTDKYKIYDIVKEGVVSEDTVYQLRRKYIRENKSGVCPTLTKTMGTGGHNVPLVKQGDIIRKLTPRECFRLQGFPETYKLPDSLSDTELYKLAGNAISPPVMKLIVEKLRKIIDMSIKN